MIEHTGCGEDGAIVPTEDFDYDAVDQGIFRVSPEDLSEFTQEDVDRAIKVLSHMLAWIWQNGMKNADGVQIRAMLMCWIFLKELRPMTLSELARGFGKDKQSLGRWHDKFKQDFPCIKTPHMR